MYILSMYSLESTIEGLENDVTNLQKVIAESSEGSNAVTEEANQTIVRHQNTISNLQSTIEGLKNDVTSLQTGILYA
jgi:uncharacterized coiled-coil protein SlyX